MVSIQRGNWVSNILLVIIVVIAGICLINKFTVGIESLGTVCNGLQAQYNVNGTGKSQLLVHLSFLLLARQQAKENKMLGCDNGTNVVALGGDCLQSPCTINRHPTVRLMDFRSSIGRGLQAIPLYDKSTPHGTNEGFESQIEMNGWFQDEKLARTEYLNKLMREDYIQSYPWMASNPGGATSFNNALFNQASQQQIYIRRPQTYYDFGEITYIGNPL